MGKSHSGQLKKTIQKIKASKTQTTALAPATPVAPVAPDTLNSVLTRISDAFSGEVVPSRAVAAFAELKGINTSLSKVSEIARDRMLALVQQFGHTLKEGSRSLIANFGDYDIEARASGGNFDESKVEARLRDKGVPLARYMDETIVYRLNEGKLADAVRDGMITVEELEECRKPVVYAVQTPKKRGE